MTTPHRMFQLLLNKLVNFIIYTIKLVAYVVIKLKLRFRAMALSFDKDSCIFCKIITANGNYSNCKFFKTPNILFSNDDFIILEDIAPASDHHYLAIPKRHIIDATQLTRKDIPLGKTELGKVN